MDTVLRLSCDKLETLSTCGHKAKDITRIFSRILVEHGSRRKAARRSSLKGRERVIVSQTNIGTVSKATLGQLLRDGVERIWAFSSA